MSRSQRFALLTLAIIAIVGAFIVFQPADSEDAPKSRSASDKTSSPPPKPQAPKATVIEVRGGKPVGGPKTITLQGGERADIEVTADESGTLICTATTSSSPSVRAHPPGFVSRPTSTASSNSKRRTRSRSWLR